MTWPNWSMARKQVAPRPIHLQVRLVHVPPIPHEVLTGARGLRKLRGEPLHPPVDRDVVDPYVAFRQQLLDVPVC